MEFLFINQKNHSNLKNPDVVLWFIVETWCNCKSMKMFIKKSFIFLFHFPGDISTPWLKHELLKVGCVFFSWCTCIWYSDISCRICVESGVRTGVGRWIWLKWKPTIFFLFLSSVSCICIFHIPLYALYLSPYSPTASLQHDQISVGYRNSMLLGYYLWVVFGAGYGTRVSFFFRFSIFFWFV